MRSNLLWTTGCHIPSSTGERWLKPRGQHEHLQFCFSIHTGVWEGVCCANIFWLCTSFFAHSRIMFAWTVHKRASHVSILQICLFYQIFFSTHILHGYASPLRMLPTVLGTEQKAHCSSRSSNWLNLKGQSSWFQCDLIHYLISLVLLFHLIT